MASVATVRGTDLVAGAAAAPAALTGGAQLAFGFGAVLVVVALVVAGLVLRPEPVEATDATADDKEPQALPDAA
jgi:hypothetical protein